MCAIVTLSAFRKGVVCDFPPRAFNLFNTRSTQIPIGVLVAVILLFSNCKVRSGVLVGLSLGKADSVSLDALPGTLFGGVALQRLAPSCLPFAAPASAPSFYTH